MDVGEGKKVLEQIRERNPEKFASLEEIFGRIRPGNRIFIGTGCGEPQYLVRSLIEYVETHPKAFFDAEVVRVFSLGEALYANEKYEPNFRADSFLVDESTHEALGAGLADYTPIFLFKVPEFIERGHIPIDVVMIQASLPDAGGVMSLGVSVDVVRAAVGSASLVIAQVNSHMPWVFGDGLIQVDDVDFIVPEDEPVLEHCEPADEEVVGRIGRYVSELVRDGDTIQVGLGDIPNAVLRCLRDRKHLGVHTELLSDGIVELMKRGVVDNSRKTVDRGKTVAAYCVGTRETYEYLHKNPLIEFRTVDYTNHPVVIGQQENMVAINTAMEIDLTGQATTEYTGRKYYGGIGGQADFMRGTSLARNGRSVLLIPATGEEGKASRIVPVLGTEAGITFGRADVHYVVTEFGIANLQGKNIRARAMELIAIAHPKFRPWLVREAKGLNLIYQDQAVIEEEGCEYPEEAEVRTVLKNGREVFLRPVRMCDEPLLKSFFYALSEKSLYQRFVSTRKDMPHSRLQEFTVVDYANDMIVLAGIKEGDREKVVGVGQYNVHPGTDLAEISVVVGDEYQGAGVGTELVGCLTRVAKQRGVKGFIAEVLPGNSSMIRVFEKMGYDLKKEYLEDSYLLKMIFRED